MEQKPTVKVVFGTGPLGFAVARHLSGRGDGVRWAAC